MAEKMENNNYEVSLAQDKEQMLGLFTKDGALLSRKGLKLS